MEGVKYRWILNTTETYQTAAGKVKVSRSLYRPSGRGSKSICPLELQAGIIEGHWTPRAGRQGAFVVGHITPKQGVELFKEIGGMTPSQSSLDRLPKLLNPHWEENREEWEEILRKEEKVEAKASTVTISVDGVMMRVKEGQKGIKRTEAGKHASGPKGQREAGCGTVTLYDAQGERLQTVRYGRMPERKKATLHQQLQAELSSVLTERPELRCVLLSDGAKNNWHLLAQIDQACNTSKQPSLQIVDFCHACDHLKKGCDAAWGESTTESQLLFERLRLLLKEHDQGVQYIIKILKHKRNQARGNRRKRLDTQLTYFCNQKHRMKYSEYLLQGLPIASGIIEATCKTLVTQRLKLSGMSWSLSGGQPILTFRSLIQSNRWQSAWALLRSAFCKSVIVSNPDPIPKPVPCPSAPSSLLSHYSRLPLAV